MRSFYFPKHGRAVIPDGLLDLSGLSDLRILILQDNIRIQEVLFFFFIPKFIYSFKVSSAFSSSPISLS